MSNFERQQFHQERAITVAELMPESGGGGCHGHLLTSANYSRMAGFSEDEFVSFIRPYIHGKRPVPDKEIRDAYQKAELDLQPATDLGSGYVPGQFAKQPDPVLAADLAGLKSATEKDIKSLSPVSIPDTPEDETRAHLETMYKPDDRVFIGTKYDKGEPEVSIRKRDGWIADLPKAPLYIVNPLTGDQALTGNGKLSYRCDNAVANHRYMVVEFDEATPEQQLAICRCLIQSGCVVMITHSGNKSYHVIIKIDAENADHFKQIKDKLKPYLMAIGADPACFNPARLTRMPGTTRPDNGKPQRLTYLNPDVRANVKRLEDLLRGLCKQPDNIQDAWERITLFDSELCEEQAPFPLDSLPEALRSASLESARFFKVDPMSPAIIGISTIATAIGRKAKIEERPGLWHYAALFLMAVAGPSERKTPVAKTMTAPLNEWAQEQIPLYENAVSEARIKNSLVEAAQSRCEKDAKQGGANLEKLAAEIQALEGQKIAPPPPPRKYTTDPTEQRLFQLMYQQGGEYAAISSEGRAVINSILGRYSDGTGEAIYLAGISGDCITRDRVGNQHGPEEKAIFDPCLNVGIFVQPDKFWELYSNPAMRSSGLQSRIWPVMLPPTAGTREELPNEQGLNSLQLELYRQTVKKIADTQKEEPHLARLSPEAAEARRLLHNEIERQLGPDGELFDVAAAAGKACSQIVKLVLAFHIIGNPSTLNDDSSSIDLATWQQAEDVGRFFLSEAIRLQRISSENIEIERSIRVANWLKAKQIGKISVRDLMRNGPRPRLNKADAHQVLSCLEEHNVLRLQNGKEYTVNPFLFKNLSPMSPVSPALPLKLKNQKNSNTPATVATTATDYVPASEFEEF